VARQQVDWFGRNVNERVNLKNHLIVITLSCVGACGAPGPDDRVAGADVVDPQGLRGCYEVEIGEWHTREPVWELPGPNPFGFPTRFSLDLQRADTAEEWKFSILPQRWEGGAAPRVGAALVAGVDSLDFGTSDGYVGLTARVGNLDRDTLTGRIRVWMDYEPDPADIPRAAMKLIRIDCGTALPRTRVERDPRYRR